MPALAIPPDLMEFLRSRDENMRPYLTPAVLLQCMEWFLWRDDGFYREFSPQIREMLERAEKRWGQPETEKKAGKAREQIGGGVKPGNREERAEKKGAREAEREQKKPGKSAGRKPKESGKEASLKKLLTKSRKA